MLALNAGVLSRHPSQRHFQSASRCSVVSRSVMEAIRYPLFSLAVSARARRDMNIRNAVRVEFQ